MDDVQYIYVVEGLSDINLAEQEGAKVRKAAMRAVNKATTKGRTASGRAIRNHANLPAGYLTGAAGRLVLSKAASQSNLERDITGRRRPTSLARYTNMKVLTPEQGRRNKRGVKVAVKPGGAKYIKRGFVMRLKSGGSESNNLGLAIRTDGGAPAGSFKAKRINDKLWLVYGLSVDTLFRRVIDEVSPGIADDMEAEFWRQLNLDGA